MSAQAAFVNQTAIFWRAEELTDSLKKAQAKSRIVDTRSEKPSGKINLNTSKPASSKSIAPATDLKTLSNVKVFPNPVADHLNLSYVVSKDSNVTIKIMDVLGNEISTLLSQRLQAGEQLNSFPIASSLNSGYYFIRVIVGNETIVKRISVL
jgi:hypothetical protein